MQFYIVIHMGVVSYMYLALYGLRVRYLYIMTGLWWECENSLTSTGVFFDNAIDMWSGSQENSCRARMLHRGLRNTISFPN